MHSRQTTNHFAVTGVGEENLCFDNFSGNLTFLNHFKDLKFPHKPLCRLLYSMDREGGHFAKTGGKYICVQARYVGVL